MRKAISLLAEAALRDVLWVAALSQNMQETVYTLTRLSSRVIQRADAEIPRLSRFVLY